ncbi:MAG: 9-O-acetylesterase [Phycisphaera sp.]|nr:9-O-acetylesterase [Phycisphaera sp.]
MNTSVSRLAMTLLTTKSVLLSILFSLLLGFGPVFAAVNVPSVISDGMVLQREREVPIWGWGRAGDKVSVSFAGQTVEGVVAKDGSWKVVLEPLKASAENRSMTIAVGSDRLEIKDVVVGEVWVCSGQSNMAMNLKGCSQKRENPTYQPVADAIAGELGSSLDPLIRQITVRAATSYNKELSNFEGAWIKADSADSKMSFTAVGYFFAKELRAKLNVPIGLLACPWGGRKIQPFIPTTQYKKNPALAKYYDGEMATVGPAMENYDSDAMEARYNKSVEIWKQRAEQAKKEGTKPPRQPRKSFAPDKNPDLPGTLYNAMVNPLIPYAIRGALWYQGESNAPGAEKAEFSYETYLRNLVDGWRDRWGQGDFPFYYCQLAQFEKPINKNGWIVVCNDMRKAMDQKNVGMAVLNDIGEPEEVHSRNKVDVGKRLALWALAKDYGFDLVCSGPIYKSSTITGNEVVIQFDSVGEGLMVARKHLLEPAKPVDEELSGFEICGQDGQWKVAKAKISGKAQVTVWHPDIAHPVAVRYAWASNPATANLYNQSGLPTSLFSTKD